MEPVNVPQAAEKNGVRPCAASLWQLHIILWKNVYVKRLRRHYVTTILEVALVVALLLGIQEYAVTRETMKVRPDTHFPTSAPTKYWNIMPDVVAIDKVLYHPKSQYLSKLVRESFSDLGVLDVSAVDSLKNLNYAINKLNDTPTVVIGLHFKNVHPNTTKVPSSLDCVVVAGRLPLDTHVDFGEKLLSQPPGPANEAHFVEMNTIMPIIGTLQQRHLEYLALRRNLSTAAVPPVKLQRFPYPSYIEEMDISNYALVLSRFCIGMLVPFAVFAARLTDEKTSGMREMLRIVGLSDWVYWASHYLSAFFMHLITVTLMLLFLCIKHNDKGRSFIQSSDPFLVFAILMCFCSSCLLHAALLSLFFANPASAVAGAMLYWTLSSAMPFLILDQGTGHGYHFISRKHKLLTSIFPGMNLHWIFRVLNRFEKFVDTGATWGNFFDHSATPDNVTVAEIVAVGLVFDCFIALLVWYLDNVLPIGPGITRPFYFPFTASYWVPRIEFVTTPEKTAQEKDNFEAEPKDQGVAIEIVQACKDYDTVRAVCSGNLRILESQITVLLGHNGAGKSTLLNIITGFIDSSSGTVLLRGYDIRKSPRDARESIGYCAQHNILFDDLTVEEHLLFFAIVRGIPRDRVRLEVVTLLRDVGLTSVSDQLAVSLTSGLQRRLCTALAVVGNPKIVVLDEPTANMDPDGRREMWELLLKVRRNSAILLTTQHLDEADVLGDRIAIMANGRIRCVGSPTFLKHRFTTGYHLQVNKTPQCNLLAIEFLLRKYAPRAHLQSDSDNEAIFVVGQIVATRHTITMFKELEQRKEELGFESLGLAVTTLEDVLMRVGEEHHIHRHHVHPDADDNQEMIEARQSVIKVIVSTKRSKPSLVKKSFALLSKRAICTRRQWRMPLFSWILPPLLLFVLFFLENATLRGSGYARGGRDNELGYRFHKVLGSGRGFIQHDTQTEFIQKYLRKVLSQQQFEAVNLPSDVDVKQYLLDMGRNTLREYVFDEHAGFQFTKQAGTLLWYNGQNPHAGLLVLAAYNTARLRNLTGNPRSRMTVSVHANPVGMIEEDEAEQNQNTYREVMPKILRSILFPMVSSLMCSNFVIFPITERVVQVKHLHLMGGVSTLLYWTVHFFWDFLFYMGTALFVLPPILLQAESFTDRDLRSIILLNLLHGFAALPGIYVMSFAFDNPTFGYSMLAISSFVLSLLGSLATVFMEHFSHNLKAPFVTVALEVMLQVMRLVPSFSYSRGMTKILQLSRENVICRKGGVDLERICNTHAIDFKPALKLCCETPEHQRFEHMLIQPLSAHHYSAFYEAVTLAVEGCVLFLVLMFFESRWVSRTESMLSAPKEKSSFSVASSLAPSPSRHQVEDSDVVRENQLVEGMGQSSRRASSMLVSPIHKTTMFVSRLTKAYGWREKKPVLQGLSFTLRTGECFGLLGVNGAGKTTTFRILTGYFMPASGDACINTFSVVRDTRSFQRYLGYCPQRDGVLDLLTGTETLMLHCQLKGIADTTNYIEVLLEVFNMEDIAEQLVGTYSAGNRRKLSLCLSMIGTPQVLLLDEPYVGISTMARKRIINYISALQRAAKMSIVLTSHSLTDVEFLCNRIAILSKGRLQCVGSLPHLKQKFGKGFTITVKTYPDKKQDVTYQEEVARAVKAHFRNAELVHSYEGLLEFRMTHVSFLWSEMFSRMAKIKKTFKLQDFYITDTSLEHIYLSFTHREASVAALRSARPRPVVLGL